MNQSLENIEKDTIYYNISIPYNTNGNSPAVYQEQLNQPIVYFPSSYFMSVVRFQISGINIPTFIARIQPYPNTNLNNTIYSVAIGYNGSFSPQTYVQYVPSDDTATKSIPLSPDHPIVDYTPYYYVYGYVDFLTMVNTALATAFASITTPVGSHPPYFIYNPDTLTISLIAEAAYYNLGPYSTPPTTPPTTPITVYINSALFHFFDAFPIFDRGFNSLNGRDIQFNINNLHDSNWYVPNGPVNPTTLYPLTLLQMKQEYQVLKDWNSLQSVQLISNMLPINREYVPSTNTQSGVISSKGILADFVPLLSTGPEARTSIEFVSTGAWRLIDMFGNYPITKVDLSFYWTDELDDQHIINIPNNKPATVKLVFMKKHLFSSNNFG